MAANDRYIEMILSSRTKRSRRCRESEAANDRYIENDIVIPSETLRPGRRAESNCHPERSDPDDCRESEAEGWR